MKKKNTKIKNHMEDSTKSVEVKATISVPAEHMNSIRSSIHELGGIFVINDVKVEYQIPAKRKKRGPKAKKLHWKTAAKLKREAKNK